jgi:hypothetical protein
MSTEEKKFLLLFCAELTKFEFSYFYLISLIHDWVFYDHPLVIGDCSSVVCCDEFWLLISTCFPWYESETENIWPFLPSIMDGWSTHFPFIHGAPIRHNIKKINFWEINLQIIWVSNPSGLSNIYCCLVKYKFPFNLNVKNIGNSLLNLDRNGNIFSADKLFAIQIAFQKVLDKY